MIYVSTLRDVDGNTIGKVGAVTEKGKRPGPSDIVFLGAKGEDVGPAIAKMKAAKAASTTENGG